MPPMKSKKTSLKPLYERPGRLSPRRSVPVPGKKQNEDLKITVHYDDGEDEYSDPVKGTTPEFTAGSLNALDPFEDEALLSGEVKPKNTGKRSGVESFESQIFEAEEDFDDEEEEEEDPSVFNRDGHTFMMNSDLMAGGAEPVHARSAFEAGKPSFFTDIKKLSLILVGLAILIFAEAVGLILLLR